jgi:hypothetical protein
MKHQKGFAGITVLLIALGIIILGGVGYVAMNPQVLQKSASKTAVAKTSIAWRFANAGEVDAMPHTKVTAVVNGTAYEAGTFVGSCSEIGASGGVDGKGLLAGELSAAQCWFAGGGNEIGVFAHEDGGFEIMTGELSEGEPNAPMFRGDFHVKTSIPL